LTDSEKLAILWEHFIAEHPEVH